MNHVAETHRCAGVDAALIARLYAALPRERLRAHLLAKRLQMVTPKLLTRVSPQPYHAGLCPVGAFAMQDTCPTGSATAVQHDLQRRFDSFLPQP
jgi:hypothetical protein